MDASREADRLSALPDDLLVDIVERLSDLRTTIRISTLSRRWARIPRLLPVLEIDVYDVMTRADSEFTTCSAEAAAAAHAATARWLLMDQPTGGGRKKLFLAFYLIDSFLQSLGHAVGDAVERGHTECLEFTIWTQVSAASASDLDLDLYGKKFMDACPVAFSWLTSLTLHNLCFGADDARRLLDAAIRLETLCLSHCASQTEVLEIDAPRSQLMVLELLSCYFEKVDLIRVPQLGQVNCDDWSGENNPPLRFGYVPRLHNVSLASSWQWQEPFALSECLSNTRNLSIVHLSFRGAKIWVKPEEPNQLFPVFSNLRDMYLYDISHESELDWTLYVLHAAPSLRNLYIKMISLMP
nr:unnamed protein product [Digitaria exilis]